MSRRFSYFCEPLPPAFTLTGYLANWKMFDPKSVKPDSIDACIAPIAVITEITEKTPIVIPSMVRAERSLFAPTEARAIVRISRNCMKRGSGVVEDGKIHFSATPLFVAQRRHRIESRRRPRLRDPRNQPGQDRYDHARDDQTEGKTNRKGRKRRGHTEAHQVGKDQADQSADEAKSG